jgi:hypothetical protein
MHVFPITKVSSDDSSEDLSEIIGYQALSEDGKVLSTGESIEETTEKALAAMFLDESNPAPKKLLNPRLLTKWANVTK